VQWLQKPSPRSPVICPAGLTRDTHFILAGIVIVANAAIYGFIFLRRRRPVSG